MEPLIELHRSRWPELRDLYRDNWPKNVVAYCLLDTQISITDLSERFNFKVYCPYGDIANGMVAIIDQDKYEVMIHPVNNIDKIEEALATTKLIDSNKVFMVPFAKQEVEDCLKRIKHFGEKVRGEKAVKHILNRNSPKFDISTPPNTYVAQVKPEHIKFIDEKWTYHGKTTYKFFEALMKNDLTYTLYSTDDEPLAWVVIDTAGALTHLYCVDKHRRKGYAEFILKYAVNDRLSKGKDNLAFTLENNLKAQKLFDKLKFEIIGSDKWLIVFC